MPGDDNDKHWPEARRAFDTGGHAASHDPERVAREPDPSDPPVPPVSSQFLPPHHPARRSAEAKAQREPRDIATRLDDIARSPELAKAVETPTRASVEDAAAERHYHTLDLISAQTIEKLQRLRKQLDELEKVVVADGNRLKTEIAAHVELARSANSQADVLEQAISAMQEYQAKFRKKD